MPPKEYFKKHAVITQKTVKGVFEGCGLVLFDKEMTDPSSAVSTNKSHKNEPRVHGVNE